MEHWREIVFFASCSSVAAAAVDWGIADWGWE
jgi:hypothetical protein